VVGVGERSSLVKSWRTNATECTCGKLFGRPIGVTISPRCERTEKTEIHQPFQDHDRHKKTRINAPTKKAHTLLAKVIGIPNTNCQ
jgi:hypothetical protein